MLAEEWLVKLVKKDHTWTRFLRDSSEVLTMAVIGSKFLEFSGLMRYRRRYQQLPTAPNGKAKILELGAHVLESAILVNEKRGSRTHPRWKARKIRVR